MKRKPIPPLRERLYRGLLGGGGVPGGAVMDYTDDVRGIVIGGDDGLTLYTFYIRMPPGIEHYIDTALCRDDAEAEAYIKAQYPVEYAMGIEMRVFDKARLAERFNLG